MRANRFTLSALALLASVSLAAAQQAPTKDDGPLSGGPVKSQQGGKEEPGSHTSGANNDKQQDAVLVDGKLNVPGAPQDSQTNPAKFSERNAKLDQEPLVKQQPTR